MDLKQFQSEILVHRDVLVRRAMRWTHDIDAAEDLVQETLLKLWQIREQLDKYRNKKAMTITVMHNLLISGIRKESHLQTVPIESYDATVETPMPLEQREEEQYLNRLITMLPPLQRTIIEMKELYDYEIDDIAEITGCSREAVRKNLSRGRLKLREMLENRACEAMIDRS